MLSQTVASSIVVEARKISDKQTMAIDFLDLEGNSKYNLKLKNFDNISNIFAIYHTTAFYIDATIFSYNPYKYIA